MTEMLQTPVTDASSWTAADVRRDRSWLRAFEPAEIEDLELALRSVRGRGIPWWELRREDFELRRLGPALAEARDELERGRGFRVFRGLPVGRYEPNDADTLAFGLALHLGTPIVQNVHGALVEHVADRGGDPGSLHSRGYTTNAGLTPHCDSGDVVSLLCVRKAKEGGISTIASFSSVYNEILLRNPEALEPLYRGFYYNIRGGGPPGPWRNVTRHRVPVYTYHRGRLSGRLNAAMVRSAERIPGVEPLTEPEKAAIALVESLAVSPDLRLDMDLEPGDLQLLSNHTILHTRSPFVDFTEPDRKRLMLRVWINLPDARELPPEFADHYNTGPGGGPFVHHPPPYAARNA